VSIPVRTPSDIGRLVRSARKAEGLRQDDAAGAIGVSDVFMWSLEKGAPGARLDKVLAVLAGLGVYLHAEVSAETGRAYDALAQPSAGKTRTRPRTRRGRPPRSA
jgi:transcriptional regulator with XRE-family HTH domain